MLVQHALTDLVAGDHVLFTYLQRLTYDKLAEALSHLPAAE